MSGMPATPGPVSANSPADRQRPWWNEIDVLLGVAWYAGIIIVAGIVSLIAVTIGGDDLADEPVYALFFGTLVLQVLLATYPWLVSQRKGLGLESDWKFVSSLPSDIFYGLGLGVACLAGAQLITLVVAAGVGLEDTDDASNTAILTDNQSSPWIIGIILLVIVGAPLAEELFFRGLILRIFQKRFGSAFAVIVSSFMFALPHWQPDASWKETMVLLTALGGVGVILALGAIQLGRLGPAVIGHFFFNGAGTIFTLLWS